MIFNLPNPIPLTVRDSEDLGGVFRKYGLIPYYGTSELTSHGTLDLLTTVASLSPTYQMVTKDIREYTFGQNIDFVGRSHPGLAEGETSELDYDDKVEFAQFLSGLGIKLTNIRKLSKRIKSHMDVTGNAYLKIRRITVGGTVRYFMEVPHYKHVAYLNSKDPNERFLIISKFLNNEQLMNKYPPEILRATQAGEELKWSSFARGDDRAIIHIKNDSDDDESDYYARPDILTCLTWMYVDFQLGNLNSKVAATDLITKKLLAFEAPDPNTFPVEDDIPSELDENGNIGRKKLSQFQSNMLVLKNLVSNLGTHPSTIGPGMNPSAAIAGVQYPHGGHAPTVIDLEMNGNTDHHTWQADRATATICGVLGWVPELIGMRTAKATLGGNLIYDLFSIKNVSTVQPAKNFFQDLWNDVIGQICEDNSGPTEFKDYGIQFPDVISEMIEKINAAKEQPNAAELINETGDE